MSFIDKRWSLTCVCLLVWFISKSQYNPVASNFFAYKTMYNPALVGERDCFSISGMYKRSWVNVTDAPEVLFISVQTPLKNEKLAVGGIISQYARGGISDFEILPALSYTIRGKESELRFGLSTGLQMYTPQSNYNVNDTGDRLFESGRNTFFPQLSAGIYYTWRNLFIGVSNPSFLQIHSYSVDSKAEWNKSFTGLLGGKFVLNEDLLLRASGLWQYNAIHEFMLESMLLYKEMYGVGLVYAGLKKWGVNAQLQISRQLSVMYSMDINSGLYNNFNYSHEIGFIYDFKYVVDSPGVNFF